MPQRKPNLFLIGAPKCGTTAMSAYLRSHPQVFFCDPKEPHYFCPDVKRLPRFDTLQSYLELFATAREQRWLAEGSTTYIFSSVAIDEILAFDPQARFVAFVRNPIEQCRSFHRQLINNQDEDVLEFERAWRLQVPRARGSEIPVRCRYPALLQYRAIASMGSLVERFMRRVPPAQRHVVVYDDLRGDTARVYADALAFLGLPHDGRNDFAVINRAHEYVFPRAMRWLRRPPRALKKIADHARRLNRARSLGIYRRLDDCLERYGRRESSIAPLSAAMHAELVDCFGDEVLLLSKLLGRDLSAWLRSSP